MKEITVIHIIDGEDKAYTGWQIAPDAVMEVDGDGISFAQYKAITGDTVRFNDASVYFDVAFESTALQALGGAVAHMTMAEIGQLLLTKKGRN